MLIKKETLHLTDLLFFEFCHDCFGINRGVYNTIDFWFYEQGQTDLIERRSHILYFLRFNHEMNQKNKFGKGGLSTLLNEYWIWNTSQNVRQLI